MVELSRDIVELHRDMVELFRYMVEHPWWSCRRTLVSYP